VVKLESSVSGLSFTVQKQGEKLTKLEGLSEAVAELQPRVFSLETTVQGIAAKLKTDEEQLKQLYPPGQ
jgi:predicted  nucleic acid-binding Zn-ribbon protein